MKLRILFLVLFTQFNFFYAQTIRLVNVTPTSSYSVEQGTGLHIGHDSGNTTLNGVRNVFVGVRTGTRTTTGEDNCFLGYQSGYANESGNKNTFLGKSSGAGDIDGSNNTYVGFASGYQGSGSNNSYLGYRTGYSNIGGVGNVFLGYDVGSTFTGPVDNTLLIGNSSSSNLIFGNFSTKFVDINGSLGVNLTSNQIPSNRLEIRHGSNGFSGLRFTNLKSSNNSIPNPTSKVLSVNANGDVILVNDMVGSGTTNQTTISAGENITVSGDPTSGYVINSTANSCNLFSCDGTIDTSLGGTNNPNSNLRTITMGTNNLHFKTSTNYEDNFVGSGRIYIGGTLNFPIFNGNNSHYRLLVEGGILTEKVKIALSTTTDWADYVFSDEYKLMPLNEVEMFIKENNHLPGIKSAKDLVETGLDVSEMQSKQMEKIEELTLYVIEQNKKLEKQTNEIEELKAQVKLLLDRK
jgi:hypothetical protein